MTEQQLKTLTLRISPEEHKQIKRLSVETGKSIKDLMMECLQRLVREYEEATKDEDKEE